MNDNDATQARQDDATKQLRAMLDERGVEWRKWTYCNIDIGTIFSASGIEWIVLWDPEANNLSIGNYKINLTAEQIIAATLGKESCTLEVNFDASNVECSECHYPMPRHANLMEIHYCPNCGRKVVV